MRRKITLVGAGNVGASCALWLAERDLTDIVLVDIAAARVCGASLRGPTGRRRFVRVIDHLI